MSERESETSETFDDARPREPGSGGYPEEAPPEQDPTPVDRDRTGDEPPPRADEDAPATGHPQHSD